MIVISQIYFLDNRVFYDTLTTGGKMKFDVIFTNPPYNRGLDIKILNSLVEQADEVVAVHPSISLVELKGNKLFNTFKKHKFKSIEC